LAATYYATYTCDLSVSKHFKNSFSSSKTNNVFMTDRSVIAD